VKRYDNDVSFLVGFQHQTASCNEVVDIRRDRIVSKADKRDLFSFNVKDGGRKVKLVGSGVFDAVLVQSFPRAGGTARTKIESVVVRDAHDIKSGSF